MKNNWEAGAGGASDVCATCKWGKVFVLRAYGIIRAAACKDCICRAHGWARFCEQVPVYYGE